MGPIIKAEQNELSFFCLILLLFFYVRTYLDIYSMKLVTYGIDHIVTADKNTPRLQYSLKSIQKTAVRERFQQDQ